MYDYHLDAPIRRANVTQVQKFSPGTLIVDALAIKLRKPGGMGPEEVHVQCTEFARSDRSGHVNNDI